MIAKEIWYVWDGKGVAPNSRDVMGSLLRNGIYVAAGNALVWEWDCLVSDYDVVAYTIGEKRELVVCDECMGSGREIDWGDSNCPPIEETECYSCQGRGYYWEIELNQ